MQSYAFLATTQMHNPCLLYWVSPMEYNRVLTLCDLKFVGTVAPVHGFFYAPEPSPDK